MDTSDVDLGSWVASEDRAGQQAMLGRWAEHCRLSEGQRLSTAPEVSSLAE